MSNEIRKALKAALKDPALVKRVTKDAAESFVRGQVWREADKLRDEMEGREENAAEEATEGEAPRSAAPAPAPVRHVSPAQMAAAGRRK